MVDDENSLVMGLDGGLNHLNLRAGFGVSRSFIDIVSTQPHGSETRTTVVMGSIALLNSGMNDAPLIRKEAVTRKIAYRIPQPR